jgi:hypothetical protein
VAVEVFADLTNRKFVASSKGGSPKSFASPFHQDKLYLSVQPLEIDSIGAQTNAPYEILDGSAFSLSVLITKTDGTTLAGPATTWTPDGTAKVGSVDLNTVAMATAFVSSATLSIDAYVFMQFDDGANRKTTIQDVLTIKRSYITSGTPSELAIARYPTWEEALAVFVRFSGNPNGSTVTLPSPGGAWKVIVGANDDGSGGASIEQ